MPVVTELSSIYPNPFNPSTTIRYSLASSAEVSFDIYNAKGQLVRTFREGDKPSGFYTLIWNGKDQQGRDCGTGVYFFRMNASKNSFIRKAVLLK